MDAEEITIKINYNGELTDYTLRGEKVGDYAVHPILSGRMFNGRLQHGPGYTISGPSSFSLPDFRTWETALACARELNTLVTFAELERITNDDGRTQAESVTLASAKYMVREYRELELSEMSK
jgi:hypothetical protein